MRPIGGESILFTRDPELDETGDPKPGTGVSKTISGCATWPAGTSEQSFRGDSVSDDRVALVPVLPTELGSNWTALLDGRTYHIAGVPQAWKWLTGEIRGTQVKLEYDGTGHA